MENVSKEFVIVTLDGQVVIVQFVFVKIIVTIMVIVKQMDYVDATVDGKEKHVAKHIVLLDVVKLVYVFFLDFVTVLILLIMVQLVIRDIVHSLKIENAMEKDFASMQDVNAKMDGKVMIVVNQFVLEDVQVMEIVLFQEFANVMQTGQEQCVKTSIVQMIVQDMENAIQLLKNAIVSLDILGNLALFHFVHKVAQLKMDSVLNQIVVSAQISLL